MATTEFMPPEYLELASLRASIKPYPYRQPEDFWEYDFKSWVSPYTKGANRMGGVALILQDWASSDGLEKEFDADVQTLGRTRGLRTNRRLECLLKRVFGLALEDVYATNVFPFIKNGPMSAAIPVRDVRFAVRHFTIREIQIVNPTLILTLGKVAHDALADLGFSFACPCVRLPHPAARIGGVSKHEEAWRKALGNQNIFPPKSQLQMMSNQPLQPTICPIANSCDACSFTRIDARSNCG